MKPGTDASYFRILTGGNQPVAPGHMARKLPLLYRDQELDELLAATCKLSPPAMT